ncbi:DUF1761 domain-containing protein [Mammaliicoccus sciuri]|uniref:DUF1761 domain-containing protein n=1 Tax=Mammaliicoccus sciuri TaxID=1296 RepID=A0AAI8DL26_MAMSC|nr:DUF1761 domain-containing protein [Mammaliicoccus sciuri]ASE35709.1 DUF1761 domain-containing protein [Mammaliicoccus sciuri]
MNIVAIVLSGILAFMVGALWYSIIFGKVWMREVGVNKETIESSDGGKKEMLISLITEILVAFLIFYLLHHINLNVIFGGVVIAFIAVASSLKNYLFEMKSIKLILINESYKIVCIMIMTITFYYLG